VRPHKRICLYAREFLFVDAQWKLIGSILGSMPLESILSNISSDFLRTLVILSLVLCSRVALSDDGYLACRKQSSDKSRAGADHEKHFQVDPF